MIRIARFGVRLKPLAASEALPGLEDELITPPGDPEDVKVRDFFGVLRFCAIESPLRCPRVS